MLHQNFFHYFRNSSTNFLTHFRSRVLIASTVGNCRSDYRLPVVQGEAVRLAVQAVPESPVTFTSFDLGQFSNQLTTITVLADENGVASTEFLATPGTINDVNILAASPMASGQVKFVVNVSLPSSSGAE